MSLNWNISKVRNWQKKQEKDGHTLECLIWALPSEWAISMKRPQKSFFIV